MLDDTYALILAGGSGTRFWPLSRNTTPKQLLRLFDDTTLLEQSIARLDGLIPRQNIIILTNWEQEAQVRATLSTHPEENIIAEPEKRDTGPAVALGIGLIAARNPNASMAVLPADHLIQDAEEFRRVLRGAVAAATRSNALVTIGVKPTWACPSYGYIERGQRAMIRGLEEGVAVYEVARFREKPNAELAEEFLSRGHFVWNAGMFVWCLATVVAELTQHCPELAHFINELVHSRDRCGTLKAQFGRLPRISIDYALMEKASRVLNIEATFDWDDVGSWLSVAKYLPRDADDNAARATTTTLDASGNIVFSSEPIHIGLLGVKDLIVVQTKDALLIADKHSADKIKKLVERVPRELW
ncbi:MAG: mannose-1-phosphate guanylyltransferase [Verrucomicrobiales bacterium]